ncbi:MAG: CopG family transcriptional regulator [Thiohalomonadales bacterium]
MGQVTIYLEDDIEIKMCAAAKSANLSKSKWIAKLIKSQVSDEWPDAVVALAGAWGDFTLTEEDRSNLGSDAKRETL